MRSTHRARQKMLGGKRVFEFAGVVGGQADISLVTIGCAARILMNAILGIH